MRHNKLTHTAIIYILNLCASSLARPSSLPMLVLSTLCPIFSLVFYFFLLSFLSKLLPLFYLFLAPITVILLPTTHAICLSRPLAHNFSLLIPHTPFPTPFPVPTIHKPPPLSPLLLFLLYPFSPTCPPTSLSLNPCHYPSLYPTFSPSPFSLILRLHLSPSPLPYASLLSPFPILRLPLPPTPHPLPEPTNNQHNSPLPRM